MFIAHNKPELLQAIKQKEASSLKDAAFYVEHYLTETRHIELQIVADNYGQVIHLEERECSLQRHNQKLFEEAPSKRLVSGTKAKSRRSLPLEPLKVSIILI